MGSTQKPKKSGTGVLIASLSVAALLAAPCAWYAAYHDQLAAPTSGPARPGSAAPRPSGVINIGLLTPGQARTVQIQHTGGQVVTTISDSRMTLTMRSVDPRPPSNPLDVLGQSLCDHYNAWKCEKGNPHRTAGLITASGTTSLSVTLKAGSPLIPLTSLAPAHAPGTRAPGSPPPLAARTPAGP